MPFYHHWYFWVVIWLGFNYVGLPVLFIVGTACNKLTHYSTYPGERTPQRGITYYDDSLHHS
jgi:hypothetical protein